MKIAPKISLLLSNGANAIRVSEFQLSTTESQTGNDQKVNKN